ncbi:MAG: helix-turn-helix transcriptional regulator [Gammaproteobacteria bacterium]|nr:helix-turn-helix transcriptional regulator [Gammaproteobacteria bacterium]
MTPLEEFKTNASRASRLLKALANPDRLIVLCNLADGEKCVGDLERILEIRQPTLSQQLARLRADHLVTTRREGKLVYYSLASNEAGEIIALLHRLYCAQASDAVPGQTTSAQADEHPSADGDDPVDGQHAA